MKINYITQVKAENMYVVHGPTIKKIPYLSQLCALMFNSNIYNVERQK